MKLTGGTERAQKWISDRKAEGKLIDVYSDEWYANRAASESLSQSWFNDLKLEFEQLEFDDEYLHHMLVVHIGGCGEEAKHELVSVYPPLGEVIGARLHQPDFLFINLKTQQILCAGLGRNNRLFILDAATGTSINAFGMLDCGDEHYIDSFTALDHATFVEDILVALSQLGNALDDYSRTPGNPDSVERALDSKPSVDSIYFIEGEDEGFSREELIGFKQSHEKSAQRCKAAMGVINSFFPDCFDGDFNTGDY